MQRNTASNLQLTNIDNSKHLEDKMCTSAAKSLKEYTENGNLHGISYIGDNSRHWFERFIKTQLLFILIINIFYFTKQIILDPHFYDFTLFCDNNDL